MRKFKIIQLLLVCLAFASCTQEEADILSVNDCPVTTSCLRAEQTFNLKFLNKNSDTDLLFGIGNSGIKYNLNDVKIYSSRFKKNLDFRIDSSNKTNRFLFFSTPVTDEFVISLANLPVDKLSSETQFIDKPCCDELRLTKLTLNATPIAFTQFLPTTIILKK